MKKVVLINSSPRKKNTYVLLCSVEKLLQKEGFKTELVHLKDYKIDFCRGCEKCILEEGCPLRDETSKIMQKMIEADGIVIGTPVYLNNMTGILKTFIDRTCSWFHRTPVAQKPVLLLANTQGSGIDSALDSIEECLIQWGVTLGGRISRNGRSFTEPIKACEIKAFVKLVNTEGKGYSPSYKEITTYTIQRVLATNVFEVDKVYWKEEGWLNNAYFPKARLNLLKRNYANTMYRLLCKVIKPLHREE